MSTIAKVKARSQRAPKALEEFRVLVATAGDPESLGAVRVASALTTECAATVLALGVAVPFPHSFPSILAVSSPLVADEKSRLQVLHEVDASVRDIPGASDWSKAAVVGWPSDAVNGTAVSWRASLIIIGLGRHGRLDRLFGTETAIAVMKHATVPVVAVNAEAQGLPRHACVAIDFTPASLASAAVAASLLGPGGKLTLLHACAFAGNDARPGDLVDLYRAGAQAKLDEAVARLRRQTTNKVDGVMIDGEPAETILEFANREQCDLIGLGGHERGLADRVILGSVRTRVLRSSKCSVLIAPPDNAKPARRSEP
jgi:nucleotide-binding universal stress UspA family protein